MDGEGRRDGDLTVKDGAVRRRWTARRRLNSDGQQWTKQRRLESSRRIDSDGWLLDGDGRCGATAYRQSDCSLTAMDGVTAL
jgi:hypothetical protein